nr:TetR/AcrR family transcriptional regulator [Nocardia crassostreae]
MPVGGSLPLAGSVTPERADAARNRKLLLDAASELIRQYGADADTMDAVARQAGVGKGTVFRRFGSRAGLMNALLDESDRELQGAYMFGPPPLGPGAPPLERLVAFGRDRLSHTEIEGDVLRAATNLPQHYAGAPYALIRTHVSMLLRQAGAPSDIALLADTLLASLEAALVLHQMRDLGYSREQIGDSWEALVRRVVPATTQ